VISTKNKCSSTFISQFYEKGIFLRLVIFSKASSKKNFLGDHLVANYLPKVEITAFGGHFVMDIFLFYEQKV